MPSAIEQFRAANAKGKEAAMLVFVSDLHLTDGSDGASLSAGAFDLFTERLNDLAARASWRTDGRYQPLDRIDLVLLGDSIDLLRSNRWQQSEARPWGDVHSAATTETVRQIVDGVLAHNAETLQHLRALSTHGGVALAPDSASGQPVFGAELIAVPVYTHYMVGNHDWMLHLPGAEYEAIRRQIIDHFGLAQDGRQPFPHEPAESESLQETLRRHRVFARHGDVFDPLHYHQQRDESSVGDVLTIELVSRFVADVEQQLGDDLPPLLLANLREMYHVRPLVLARVWLTGLLERACPSARLQKEVKRRWDALVDRLLQLEALRDRDTSDHVAGIDGLPRLLTFRGQLPNDGAAAVRRWLSDLQGSEDASYWRHAIVEPEVRNRRAKYVVYGHTHRAETLPLDASGADGFALQQLYFNTGTWRRVYQPTCWQPAQHEFVPTETMTYLAFFAGDERGGRPFEAWSGTLASLLPVSVTHRVDAARNIYASQKSLPTPTVPLARPHFAVSPAAARASSAG